MSPFRLQRNLLLNFIFSENEETSDAAVDALKQIIAVKSHVVLPFIVPKVSEL